MAEFVPQRFVPGFLVIRSLGKDDAGKLIDGLGEVGRFLPFTKLASEVEELLPEAQQESAADVVNSLISLRAQLRGGSEASPAEVAESVVYSDSIMPEDEEERDQLVDRITKLLTSAAIVTTADAADILVQHERPYRSARIFTDIRPVFDEDAANPPAGAVIVQTLSIDFWTRTGGRDTVTFGLDEADLEDLKRAVDRAITKTQTVRSFLSGAGVEPFNSEGGEKSST
ncbi:MAG: hypothetical protein JWN65_4088 [Solirubrobacterales bacterium]|nr:hypothetical protein [Solirubrobacterales bacterium]